MLVELPGRGDVDLLLDDVGAAARSNRSAMLASFEEKGKGNPRLAVEEHEGHAILQLAHGRIVRLGEEDVAVVVGVVVCGLLLQLV